MSAQIRHPLRKCPVCGGAARQFLFEQRFEGVRGAGLLDGYDVVSCSNCGAVFSDRIPASSRFSEYYASASKYEFSHRGGEQHREEVARVEGLASWLTGILPESCPILDVGCATGELLQKLSAQGFSDLTGMDPSPECIERIQQCYGFPAIRGVLRRKQPNQRSFGAVILSAVLEHIPDTDAFIDAATTWLFPGGFLVVEVPDLEFFKNSNHAPYQELSVEHVNFFTAASLENLLGRFGFRAVAKRSFICPAAPGGLTGAVLSVVGRLEGGPVSPTREQVSFKAMESYLANCRRTSGREKTILGELRASKKPILVWGVGTLCQRLLAEGGLARDQITAFVDSNCHYQGKTLAGKRILSPGEINSGEPILIASWGFQAEITETIRSQLKLCNEIVTLR